MVKKGDVNCDGSVGSLDALGDLRYVARLTQIPQNEPCPDIGSPLAALFGDVDCDDDIDAVDALFILRHVAALPVSLPAGCPAIAS